MNCKSFESIVNDLARDQIMEATVREQAVLHSAGCEMCSARLRDEHNLTKTLRELSTRMQADPTPDRVEARLASLMVEFRSRRVAQRVGVYRAVTVGGSVYRRRYWGYAAVAAAVIVVSLGVIAIRFGHVGSVPGLVAGPGEIAPPVNLVKNAAPLLPTKTPVQDLQTSQENPTKHEARPNARRFVRQATASTFRVAKSTVTVQSLDILATNSAEVTTEFIPIGYSNASNVQEGGQVVRLDLPRYAMARFGVPVNVDRYDERVKADVWVGTDGLARAIRFVQ